MTEDNPAAPLPDDAGARRERDLLDALEQLHVGFYSRSQEAQFSSRSQGFHAHREALGYLLVR